jgi:hypothetical protein
MVITPVTLKFSRTHDMSMEDRVEAKGTLHYTDSFIHSLLQTAYDASLILMIVRCTEETNSCSVLRKYSISEDNLHQCGRRTKDNCKGQFPPEEHSVDLN